MEAAYFDKGCWGSLIQIIRCLSAGLPSEDKEMKHLCLVVICHHIAQMEKEMNLFPSDLLISTEARTTLQELLQRFPTPLSS